MRWTSIAAILPLFLVMSFFIVLPFGVPGVLMVRSPDQEFLMDRAEKNGRPEPALSRSSAVANTETRNPDVSPPEPEAAVEPVLAALAESSPAEVSELSEVEPVVARAAKSAKPAVVPARALQPAPAPKPKKAAPAFGRTADELDVGY